MIFEKIEQLCYENKTTITALCKEITGSAGNLSTWKKDNIKPIWLTAICKKLDVSSDYLLGLSDDLIPSQAISVMTEDETDLLSYFRKLRRKDQRSVLVQMENILEQPSVAAGDSEAESKKSLA